MATYNFIDLTGEQFGRLKVLRRVEDKVLSNGEKLVNWECVCSCGNVTYVTGRDLKCGNTKSCGCLSREKSRNRLKKYNKYDLSGEYGIGYTSKGEQFIFDLEDYTLIKDYCWFISTNGYVMNKSPKVILQHRLISGVCGKNIEIDHINHNKADNRKENLRQVTRSQNNMNHGIKRSNTSGNTGIYWHAKAKKWCANIRVDSKSIYLGLYIDKEDAIKARKKAEEKYFGEYSYDNSLYSIAP